MPLRAACGLWAIVCPPLSYTICYVFHNDEIPMLIFTKLPDSDDCKFIKSSISDEEVDIVHKYDADQVSLYSQLAYSDLI